MHASKKKRLTPPRITVHSGGAPGADTEWLKHLGAETDFQICAFPGFFPYSVNAQVNVIPPHTLQDADVVVDAASKSMGKVPMKISHRKNFLRRDYYIIKDVDAVYAIGILNFGLKGVGVDGGTGMTCQMYWNRGGRSLFLYDQKTNEWKRACEGAAGGSVQWEVISEPPPMGEFDIVACIGSREITKKGIEAITACKLN